MSEHKPCCDACGGTGTASEQGTDGRCWDCYGTGCAHPPIDHIDRVAEVLEIHSMEFIDHEVGYECGCNEHGTGHPEGLRFQSDALRHQSEALDAAGLLRRPTDPEVHVEATGTGRTCVVKVSGQTIFDGVGREALIRTKSAAEHDAAVAAKAVRKALRPLRDYARQKGNLSAQVASVETSDFLRALANDLNRLMDRIERDATT